MLSLDPHSEREMTRLADDVTKIPGLLDQQATQQFLDTSQRVASDARSHAPHLTGRLRNSIHVAAIDSTHVGVVAQVPYAAIQDAGGHHPVFGRGSVTQPATYFLTRAFNKHEEDAMQAADEALGIVAEKTGFPE